MVISRGLSTQLLTSGALSPVRLPPCHCSSSVFRNWNSQIEAEFRGVSCTDPSSPQESLRSSSFFRDWNSQIEAEFRGVSCTDPSSPQEPLRSLVGKPLRPSLGVVPVPVSRHEWQFSSVRSEMAIAVQRETTQCHIRSQQFFLSVLSNLSLSQHFNHIFTTVLSFSSQ